MLGDLRLNKEEIQHLRRVAPGEYAFLALTNPPKITNHEELGGAYLLAEKSAYAWAAMIDWYCVVRNAGTTPLSHIIRRTNVALGRLRAENTPSDPWAHKGSEPLQVVRRAFFRGGTPNPSAPALSLVQRQAKQRLKSLEEKELIEDPFVEMALGVPFMLLGAVPYSFTRRTENGQAVFTSIKAMLWEYESYREADKQELRLHFRVAKVVEHLKTRLPLLWSDPAARPSKE